jgi:TPP-dependent pyruvate/acetoin dehydrogenase alpha subunit
VAFHALRDAFDERRTASDAQEDEIQSGVKKLLNDALQRAEESPLPDPSDLTDGVYATPDDLDTPHHK